MAHSVEVKFVDNSNSWWSRREQELSSGLEKMAQAILANARVKAPMSEGGGNLRNSGRVNGSGLERTISFGNGLKYGAYQERGKRADGTHVVKRYTTPGTGKHYLKDSGDAVVKKGIKSYL